jgi:L-fuculose-phosphate aldolase
MLITPSGARTDAITADTMVETGLDGAWDGALRPSSEWKMHARIYAQDASAGVIVHAHSDAATALACLGEGLPAFHYGIAEFGGDDVRCAPYVTFGTAALAEAAAEAMTGRSACLLANHGMICHGRDVRGALTRALLLETLCRQYLLARSAGRPVLLDEAQMNEALIRFADYGQPQKDSES